MLMRGSAVDKTHILPYILLYLWSIHHFQQFSCHYLLPKWTQF